jgi:NAD+ kinase
MLNSERVKIEKVGFFLRPNKPELKDDFIKIKESFEVFGVEVFIEEKSAEMIGEKGFSLEELSEVSDIFISLGGDGTLLSTARKTFSFKKPILPINGGNLGFLVDLKVEIAQKFIPNLIRGKYKIEKRRAFKVEIEGREDEFSLNDLLITNTKRMKMSRVNVYKFDLEMDGMRLLNSYYGDALIISTPTGSTAYNLSSGGPILHPEMSSYVLTPMAPHSLTQRPVVLPSDKNIFVGLDGSDGIISIDGQKMIKLERDKLAKISIHNDPIEIIRVEDYNFFDTLREKLGWG